MKLRLAAALLAVLAACGGNAGYDVLPDRSMAAARGITLPEPAPAIPAFLLRFENAILPTRAEKAANMRGVSVAVPLTLTERRVEGPTGISTLRVGAVDPLLFRALAPEPTRAAEFVWSALVSGEAVVTFEAAEALGIEGSGEITVGDTPLRAGAIADNGVPNLADVLVPDFVGEDAGLPGPRLLAIGVKDADRIAATGRALREGFPGAQVRRLLGEVPEPIEPSSPELVGSSSGGLIGTLHFEVAEDGFIRPDPAWVAANIAHADMPIIGSVTCHRLLIPQLHAALAEVEEAGLAGEIYEYNGCYVPRFIDRDPSKPLSMHAFGLAIDLNTATNQLGTEGDMDPRVVEIFERWGFVWGGRWSRPDPMHFE
ncbi:MAG TPA: M15 family metallopeptidase, partial [Actinomycetota bacterium]|nr:M15 family metallopeptidase [Actinomycetota bacterium]